MTQYRRPLCHPIAAALLAAALTATPASAQPTSGPLAAMPSDDLPPGLRMARLLPGWTDKAGDRVMALELLLEPGWKTYWRSPGDTGLPPQFAWAGSDNLAGVTLHWPAPQAIRSGDTLEMGYLDRLILPFTAHRADPERSVAVSAQIDLGLCENICVPAHLDLRAPQGGQGPDATITTALAAEPQQLDHSPRCRVTPIRDGVQVAMSLPGPGATLAAIELLDRPEIWVSGAQIVADAKGAMALVDMVGPTGAPFDLDPAALRLTVIPDDGSRATETTGCAPG